MKWPRKINLLCTQLNINKQSGNFKNPSAFLSKDENNLSKHLKNHQLNLIRTNRKLKFYSIFKNGTNYSEFINHIRNPEHRRVASKFRIGNHNLKIETGRFTIPKTPEDLRICDHCIQNSVENETHILFHCDLYDDLRKTLLKSTSKIHYLQITQNGNTEENLMLLVRKFGNLCIQGILALRKSSVRSTSVRMSILYVSWGEILNFKYQRILVLKNNKAIFFT